jgi:hypothetical protein
MKPAISGFRVASVPEPGTITMVVSGLVCLLIYGYRVRGRAIAGTDGDLAHQPVGPAGPARIPVTAALSEVSAGHNAQTGSNHLHENGHQAGKSDDPQEPILELSAALQVGAPVAWVHVTDADENCRPGKRPQLLPKAGLMVRHFHGAMHLFKRYLADGRCNGDAAATVGLGGQESIGSPKCPRRPPLSASPDHAHD